MLGSGAIARRIFAAGFVGGASGGDARLLFEGFGGEDFAKSPTFGFDFLPKFGRGGAVAHFGFDECTEKGGYELPKLGRDGDVLEDSWHGMGELRLGRRS